MKTYRVKVNGKLYEVELEEVKNQPDKHPRAEKTDHDAADGDGEDVVTAPMQGTIQSILAERGATVKKGDPLCILEAMKMENEVTADKDGVIAAVTISENDTVNAGDVLFKVH